MVTHTGVNPSVEANEQEQGFTLVELAIVLVIIGLIIGGVLVGQEMIKAAMIRGQITQVNQLNTAVGAYRLKYDCVPGDCAATITVPTGAGTTGAGTGDGNGIVTAYPTTAYANAAADLTPIDTTSEVIKVFVQVGHSGMYGFVGSATLSDTPTINNFPKSRISQHGIIPLGIGGYNWWHLGVNPSFPLSTAVGVMTAASGGQSPFGPSVSPFQASQIDLKMDDGMPISGSVLARVGTVSGTGIYAASGGGTGAVGALACYTGTTGSDTYTVGTASNDIPLCEMQFRWSL